MKQATKKRPGYPGNILILTISLMLFGGTLFASESDKPGGVETQWKIEGMTCQGCASGLAGGMAAIKGVVNCQVDYDSKTMVCAIDETVINKNEIPGLVKKMGYKAQPFVEKKKEIEKKNSKG